MSESENNEIERLKRLLNIQETSAKLLVRRDLELTRAYEKLQELERTKSDFISVVAHQLRTPLSVIKWAMAMLGDSASSSLTSEQQSILARGMESNERMIKLVDDLLNVDQHEVGKIQYVFSKVSVLDTLQFVVDQLSSLALQRGVELVYKLPEEEIPHIQADAEKLSAALQNIVENSLKYTHKGGRVVVSIGKKNHHVVVSIEDTGIGISSTESEKVFSKFYRGDNATKEETEGSGLGLFIARKIAKRHGGDIWFESEEGKGTKFFLSIPITANK